MQVEQRHAQSSREFFDSWPSVTVPTYFRAALAEHLASFEASLPPSAPVDRDELERIAKDMEYAVGGGMAWIDHSEAKEFCRRIRAVAAPSVLAESTSNDCLLVAEAVRERCAEICDSNAAQEREGMAELTTQRDRLAAENAAHMAEMLGAEIRSLDLSGVGVG